MRFTGHFIGRFLRFATFVALLFVGACAPVPDVVEPGTVFRDCAECPEMVVVTGAQPLAVGRYEVTFEDWKACVDDGGCDHWPDDHGWGRDQRPVINVNWFEIQGYLDWLSDKSGHRYRLPTEGEWEAVHRAGTITRFWWGDDLGRGNANCRDCGSRWDGRGSAPVGSFPPNPWGVFDTAGNVWEWTADCWHSDRPRPSGGGTSPEAVGECDERVMKGGSWYYVARTASASSRSKNDPRAGSYGIGFRVVRDLP